MKNNKYLIYSGCSYGRIVTCLYDQKFNEYLDVNDDVILIDMAKDSQSSGYSADSIIYCVNSLLSNGVNSKNIFVLNEWTQFSRTHDVFPNGVLDEIKQNSPSSNILYREYNPKSRIYGKSDVVRNQLNSILNLKYLKWRDNDFEVPIGIIDNLFYASPANIDPREYKNTPFQDWVLLMQKQMEITSNETLMISYINNILRLQNFLKLNKIEYKFHTLNSQFSGWFKTQYNVGHSEHRFVNPYDIEENGQFIDNVKAHREHINSLNKNNDIVNVFPGCKSKFNEIDLSRFWFYEKNNYRFGGIDEYSFDNFSYYGYHSPENFDLDCLPFQIPTYGNHPENPVYFLLSLELLDDCEFINFKPNAKEDVLFKIKEDLESDVSVNGYFKSNLQMSENIIFKKRELL